MKTSSTKSSGIFSGDSLGSASVEIVRGRVLELRYEKHSSRATALRSFERATEILREHPEITALAINTLNQTGHDPGNTALGVRWVSEQRGQIQRLALITRSQAVANLAAIGQVMIPWMEGKVVGTREEALAWCEQVSTRPRDSQTGMRPAGGRRNNAA